MTATRSPLRSRRDGAATREPLARGIRARLESMSGDRPDLYAARVPQSERQEPSDALEHLGPDRQLRRLGHAGAHRLGEKFARGGVGAIISSHVPVHVRGRILPNYAFIDHDDKIPFWRALGEAVHAHDCKYILQLSHWGRQQDIAGVENTKARAQLDRPPGQLHGIRASR